MTNLLIVGNTNTGKTSLVEKLLETFQEIEKDVDPEHKIFHRVRTLWIPNYGEVNIYDTNFVDLDIFDSAIIMADPDLRIVEGYKLQIREKCGDIPIAELHSYLELNNAINHNKNNFKCCCISRNYNITESFLDIINQS